MKYDLNRGLEVNFPRGVSPEAKPSAIAAEGKQLPFHGTENKVQISEAGAEAKQPVLSPKQQQLLYGSHGVGIQKVSPAPLLAEYDFSEDEVSRPPVSGQSLHLPRKTMGSGTKAARTPLNIQNQMISGGAGPPPPSPFPALLWQPMEGGDSSKMESATSVTSSRIDSCMTAAFAHPLPQSQMRTHGEVLAQTEAQTRSLLPTNQFLTYGQGSSFQIEATGLVQHEGQPQTPAHGQAVGLAQQQQASELSTTPAPVETKPRSGAEPGSQFRAFGSALREALQRKQEPDQPKRIPKTRDVATMTGQEDTLHGKRINLDGLIMHESEGGLLIVNVTYKGREFMGTLLDCSTPANTWASPRHSETPPPDKRPKSKKARGSSDIALSAVESLRSRRSTDHNKQKRGRKKRKREDDDEDYVEKRRREH